MKPHEAKWLENAEPEEILYAIKHRRQLIKERQATVKLLRDMVDWMNAKKPQIIMPKPMLRRWLMIVSATGRLK